MLNMKKFMILIALLFIVCSGIYAILSHKSFGRSPRTERLERIKNSPNYKDGKFQNLSPTPKMTSEKSGLRNMYDFIFSKKDQLKPPFPLDAIKIDLHKLDKNNDLFVWFGHSSYLIQNEGIRFLIDPVLTNKFPMSLMFKPFKGTDIYKPSDIPEIDFLIITHEHWDHLDYNTAIQLKDKVNHIICPLGVGEYFEYWGYNPDIITEMDWDDIYNINDSIAIHCLPARHFANRLFKNDQTLWASFLIEARKTIFMSGDGGYDSHFKMIGDRFPNIDLAILENGQYNEGWKHIHLMPQELPLAAADLKANNIITVHNSKFALSRHSWDNPMEEVINSSVSDYCRLLTPKIGEVIYVDKIEDNKNNKWW